MYPMLLLVILHSEMNASPMVDSLCMQIWLNDQQVNQLAQYLLYQFIRSLIVDCMYLNRHGRYCIDLLIKVCRRRNQLWKASISLTANARYLPLTRSVHYFIKITYICNEAKLISKPQFVEVAVWNQWTIDGYGFRAEECKAMLWLDDMNTTKTYESGILWIETLYWSAHTQTHTARDQHQE